MGNYLENIPESTDVDPSNNSLNLTTSENPVVEAKYNNEITESGTDLIKDVDDLDKPTEEFYPVKTVKVRKYQLYKNRGN